LVVVTFDPPGGETMRRTFLTVMVAGGLIAAAAAFVPGRHTPTAMSNADIGYGADKPRYVGAMLEDCLEEPVQCGLLW
jgi:hypothetical protein